MAPKIFVMSEKYELYVENPCTYLKLREFCGKITKKQAEGFLEKLKKYDAIPESCCFGHISAKIASKGQKRIILEKSSCQKVDYTEFLGQLLIDFGGYNCKCKSCLDNLKTGCCRDVFVRKIISEIFPQNTQQR